MLDLDAFIRVLVKAATETMLGFEWKELHTLEQETGKLRCDGA